MRRREFITCLGGAAAMWPLTARTQEGERMRRVGVLVPNPEDAAGNARIAAFQQALHLLGWTVGRNLQMEVRWAAGDTDLLRGHATELVAAAPDVILASTNQPLAPLRQATSTLPIVFVLAIDPVGKASPETDWEAINNLPHNIEVDENS
jgi:putative ABC transport system substrate-binding protein